MTTPQGFAAPGFGAVADAFGKNFERHGEIGAAVAAYVDGDLVVDLWGGSADPDSARAWEADTSAVIFSCTKGITALCVYQLVQDGVLDLDAPMARYWPEFGQADKADVTVRCVLAHRAGLPTVAAQLSYADVLGWHPVVEALAASAPLWPPGSQYMYHALTYGWLAGELIRRISGLMPGEFFARRFGRPLGLSTWIGLPAAELPRVARVLPGLPSDDPGLRAEAERVAASPAGRLAERAVTVNGAIGDLMEAFNEPAMLQAQQPAANGVSTARSLARLYAAAVTGPERAMTAESVTDAVVTRSTGRQYLSDVDDPARWGTGFMVHARGARLMLGPRSFGHDGAGGKAAFGDDEYGVGFAYLNNWMGQAPDNRADRLIAALARCLGVDRLKGSS